nr:MAG TPA: minor tail protein [Caudoviricetes sp.]
MRYLDGYLKIKTKLDNSGIDKDITELENKIKKTQTDNLGLDKEATGLQEEINQYEKLCNEADKYKEKIKQLEAERKTLTLGGLSSTNVPQYNSLTTNIDLMKQKYSQATIEIDKQASKIDKVYAKLNKIKAKQTENNAKVQEFKDKIESIKINKVQNQINNIGKGIQGQISKIGKMAFAIIGIRTAWNAVRSAINIVSQYNSQVSTDLEYMRYCIANALVPIVQSLIKLLYTALSYINAISTAWFGINLFSNSSAKNFQKMKNSASGTAKSAKEIQKSLQGFDEMNILQDNTSSTGGSTGVSAPSMDLSNVQGEIPAWLKWIIENKDLIISTLTGIATAVLLIKFGLEGIKALGIGVLIAGIMYTVMALIEYLKDPSWENFGKVIQGIGVSIIGVGVIIASVLGIVAGAPVIITGAIVLIWGTIVKYWEQIKAFFQSGIDWLKGKSDWIRQMFGDVVGDIYDNFVSGLQDVLNWLDSTMKGIKANFNEIISFIKNVFSGNWQGAWQNIKNIFSNIWEGMKNTVKTIFGLIGKMAINIGKTVGATISGAFKAVVNGVLRAIEDILNSPIRAINSLTDVINRVPGINLGYLNTFNLPRLAKGGVISQPTQAIIGEAGREAVVPLENNMEWLDVIADKLVSKIGTSGGSYIINLDGRTIQRGQAKRRQELAFATNGR